MRYVFIITATGPGSEYKLWEDAFKYFEPLNEVAGFNIQALRKIVDVNSQVIMLKEKIEKIDTIVECLLNLIKNFEPENELFIAAHGRGTYRHIHNLELDKWIYLVALVHESEEEPYKSIRAFVNEPLQENFETICNIIKKKHNLIFVQQLTVLKHRLSHVFLPIDIDLQGWKESDFDEKYAQEIVKAYTVKGENVLKRAWKLIYGDPYDREAENVQKIVNETAQSDRAEWRMVQALLPSLDGAMPESENEEKNQLAEARKLFAKAKEVLDSIQNQDSLDALKSRLRSNTPFHKWFVALDKALDDLRNAM